MKTFVISAVSIVLVSILFCPMVMAAPSMPDGLQMVQPDPSLPKELSAFFGKWEGTGNPHGRQIQYFLIVEKIDEEKASLYFWDFGPELSAAVWGRYEVKVRKEGGKYKIYFGSRNGRCELTLKGEALKLERVGNITESVRLKRVP